MDFTFSGKITVLPLLIVTLVMFDKILRLDLKPNRKVRFSKVLEALKLKRLTLVNIYSSESRIRIMSVPSAPFK